MQVSIIRLAGYTAHFRDPRTNTAKIGLPSRTLRCPPPCTIHGLLCATYGGWIEPNGLRLGWRLDYASIGIDFQTSRLPQRNEAGLQTGIKISPTEREFLAFPVLSILVVRGFEAAKFRKPVNPLSLGRSEDLIVEKLIHSVEVEPCEQATLRGQCLPLGLGSGTIYATPLYFIGNRQAVNMMPRIDAAQKQTIRSTELMQVKETEEAFYVWNFGTSAS
jgi:CRISPR-associated Cas5-like protein